MQEALVLFIAYLNRVSSTGSSEPLVKDNIDICLPTTVDIIAQKLNAKYSAIIYTYHCYWFINLYTKNLFSYFVPSPFVISRYTDNEKNDITHYCGYMLGWCTCSVHQWKFV